MALYTEYLDGKVQISTARLLLRAAKNDDAEALYEGFRDPRVMLYWSELPHKDINETRNWLPRMINAPQNGTTDFIITLKDDGKAIGKMGVWQADEIGFLLAAAHWRKGLAEEALRALLSFFFVKNGYEKLTADADPENEACLGLLKKVGFEVTGFEKNTFQVGENWVDSTYLTLRKEQWESVAMVNTA